MTKNTSDEPGQRPGAELGRDDVPDANPVKASTGNLVLWSLVLVLTTALAFTATFALRVGESLRGTAASRWPADESHAEKAERSGPSVKYQTRKGGADGAAAENGGGAAADKSQPDDPQKAGAAPTKAESTLRNNPSKSAMPVPRPLNKTIGVFNWPKSVSGYQLRPSTVSSLVTYLPTGEFGAASVVYAGKAVSDKKVTEILGGENKHSIVVDNQVICTQYDNKLTCVIRTVSHTFVGRASGDANPIALARLLSSIVAAS